MDLRSRNAIQRVNFSILGIWFKVPVVDPSLLTPVLMGMLGMGAMRSYEKTKGVQREK